MPVSRVVQQKEKSGIQIRRRKEVPALRGNEAVRFLLDNGLLFRYNHGTNHSIGISLGFEENENGEYTLVIFDHREHPDLVFDEETMIFSMEKIRAYMQARGNKTVAARRALLGFCVQPLPETEAPQAPQAPQAQLPAPGRAPRNKKAVQ